MSHRKELIQVALPVEALNAELGREKSNWHRFSSMKINPIFRIFACLATAGIALLTVQTVIAGRVESFLVPWQFRHMPYQVYWGYIQPSGGRATWGGPDYETLYVFTFNTCMDPEECIYPDGLYKTSDYGLSWEPITATVTGGGLMENETNLLATHPISPNLMISLSNGGHGNGLYRSIDYGATWTFVLPGLIYDLEFDPNHPNVAYISYCCQPNQGIYRSDDYGVTWTRIAPDLFNDLEMVGDDSGVMFGARNFSTNDYEGVYRSPDRGLTWVQLGIPNRQSRILLDPQQPGRLYAFGGDYAGIFRSDDSGANWSNVTNNLPTIISEPTIQSLFYDQRFGRLWLGLKYGGMWYSDKLGFAWQQWNYGIVAYGGGIYGPQCYETAISPKGNYFANCSGLIHFNINTWLLFLPSLRK